MSLDAAALEAYVDEVRPRVDDLDSVRALELRVVEPLLETLGWDVRSAEVEPDAPLGDDRVDYLLSVDGVAEIVVVTTPPIEEIPEERLRTVASALRSAAPDWGLVTNGATVVLLAVEDGGVHRQSVDLNDLPAAASALEHYERRATARRVASSSADLTEAVERLAANRDAAVDAVAAALVDVAGEGVEDVARARAAALVDDLAATAEGAGTSGESPDRAGTSGESPEVSSRAATEPGREAPAGAPEAASTGPADGAAAPGDAASTASTAAPTAADAASADHEAAVGDPPAVREAGEGTYVVRFFGGTASVGAVGTDTPTGTLVGVVEYLLENQDLASSIALPWGPDDGRVRLARAPEHADGSPMQFYETVAGDVVVWTGGDLDSVQTAITALADQVGLRVMFQGDW